MTPFWKTVLQFLVKFNIHLPCDTSILAALCFYTPKVKIMATQKFVQISFIYYSLKLCCVRISFVAAAGGHSPVAVQRLLLWSTNSRARRLQWLQHMD